MKWWKPSKAEEVQPRLWLHPHAVDCFALILSPDMTVCEFGGGGSTLWLAERARQVTTYEPDAEWYNALAQRVPQNVRLINRPLPEIEIPKCDIVYIDGEPIHYRDDWLAFAPYTGCKWVVLDNANRPEYSLQRAVFRNHADLVVTADGNERGTMYLVTEFWRMK
jgi:predicted O-methyltransferase YrrM